MAYLIKVGFQADLINGTTCKGYQIFRKKKTVVVRYGGINVASTINKKFHWKGQNLPQERRFPFKTEKEAKMFISDRIENKIGNGYNRLYNGIKIL